MITDLLHIPLVNTAESHKIKTVEELSPLELFAMGFAAILISSTAAILIGVT